MYSESELTETIKALEDPSPLERAGMLKALWAWPAEDERLWPVLETLLDDGAPCFFGTPMRFAEIRWLAAQALAAEYRVRNLRRKVVLQDAIQPLTFEELCELGEGQEIALPESRDDALVLFAKLSEQDLLPRTELSL